jgi:two-component system, NtrC family, response regulator HydG
MSVANVLVVDDDVAVCRILHRMLSDEQYQIQISNSVGDAVAAIEQKLFDVYVLDYKLPDGTGLDVAERIRSKGSQAPIVLISGYDPSAVALRAEKLNIFDIIEKPFSRVAICAAVKKALGLSTAAEQAAPDSFSNDLAEQAARTKNGFPKPAIVGVASFLLLLSCAAIYYFVHGH